MSDREDDALLRLAASVADGDPVDWQEAPQLPGTPAERVRRLQILASIARVYGMPPDARRFTGEVLFRWGRLEVLEKIGEGVFGKVFRAWDDTLEREVAVKFLHPDAATAAAHVLREGRHLARIRHPGVVTVYGAEELDGRIGIWMEHVRGRTLEDLLRERGPFPLREAIRIGIDLCRALAAVHAAGVVHRDVKTRNIVREESGRIVLMDFGAGVDVRAGGEQTVGPAGTPIYLAPEVLRGEPASPRSDLYGLGVLLYRLVTSGYPIAGPDLDALREAHERGEIRSLQSARPDLPAAFAHAVDRALAADPAGRFESAQQMEAALEAVLEAPHRATRRRLRIAGFAAAAVAVLGLAVVLATSRVPQTEPPADRPSIAVADVVHTADDPELDALAGMLITSLEQSRGLSVLTRSRMNGLLARSGRTGDRRIDRTLGLELGREANAVAVLVPSVRTSGTGYRLDLEAVDPRHGRTLFRVSAPAAARDRLPSAIDALASRVRTELEQGPLPTGGSARPVASITTASLSAFHHYDRAERLIDRLEMHAARAQLDSAIARDSTFGLAHSRLAYVCWWLNDQACEREQLARAFALIDRVPERQRFHLRAQGAMADRQGLEAARAILLEMERFYPYDREMLYDIGDYSSHLNEFPTAVQYLEKVVATDAGFVRALQHLARVYRDIGRHDISLEWAKQYSAVDSSWESLRILGNALAACGDVPAGIATLQRSHDRVPGHLPDVLIDLANLRVYAGQRAEGLRAYDQLIADAPTQAARGPLLRDRARARVHGGAYRAALADLANAIEIARSEGRAVEEAIAHMDAATLHLAGRNDARAAFANIEECEDLEPSITYRDVYFHYWEYWGGRFKLLLLHGDDAAAEDLARQKFTADKWYGPYVTAYLHAARGECAQAGAAASQILDWGPASENIPLLYFLARCSTEHGRLDEAAEALVRLQGLCSHLTLGTPFYAKSLRLLGEIYERKGDTRLAAESYAKLLALWRGGDSDLADLIEARRRLEVLRSAHPASPVAS